MSTEAIILHFPDTNKNYRVSSEKEVVIAGLNKNCDLCLADHFKGQINLISQRHFKIKYNAERGFFITDLHSQNGTWLNNEKLTPDHAYFLRGFDEIKLTLNEPFIIEVMGSDATMKISERIVTSSSNDIFSAQPKVQALIEPLTTKEYTVLQYLSRSLRYKTIAELMKIPLDTIKTYIKNIYQKLGVSYERLKVGRPKLRDGDSARELAIKRAKELNLLEKHDD